jgi:hypothetical protein
MPVHRSDPTFFRACRSTAAHGPNPHQHHRRGRAATQWDLGTVGTGAEIWVMRTAFGSGIDEPAATCRMVVRR